MIVSHEMELAAKQKDLVEVLNQELDDQDHELSLERSRYFTQTTVLRQLLEHERQHMLQCRPYRHQYACPPPPLMVIARLRSLPDFLMCI